METQTLDPNHALEKILDYLLAHSVPTRYLTRKARSNDLVIYTERPIPAGIGVSATAIKSDMPGTFAYRLDSLDIKVQDPARQLEKIIDHLTDRGFNILAGSLSLNPLRATLEVEKGYGIKSDIQGHGVAVKRLPSPYDRTVWRIEDFNIDPPQVGGRRYPTPQIELAFQG